MSNTFYFSYDEEGFNFFDNISDLMSSNALMNDCYVYQGNVTQQYIRDDDNNDNETRETCVLEYITQMENTIRLIEDKIRKISEVENLEPEEEEDADNL